MTIFKHIMLLSGVPDLTYAIISDLEICGWLLAQDCLWWSSFCRGISQRVLLMRISSPPPPSQLTSKPCLYPSVIFLISKAQDSLSSHNAMTKNGE
jgi:hypothetical protein